MFYYHGQIDDRERYEKELLFYEQEQEDIAKAEQEQLWEKEEAIWYEFYTTFNDDNIHHAENAFHNNGYEEYTPDQLHAKNILWVDEIISHGYSLDKIQETMPTSKEYIEEYIEIKNCLNEMQKEEIE